MRKLNFNFNIDDYKDFDPYHVHYELTKLENDKPMVRTRGYKKNFNSTTIKRPLNDAEEALLEKMMKLYQLFELEEGSKPSNNDDSKSTSEKLNLEEIKWQTRHGRNHIYHFRNLTQLLAYLKETDYTSPAFSKQASSLPEERLLHDTKTNSLEEAIKLCMNPDNEAEIFKATSTKLDHSMLDALYQPRYSHQPRGARPDVRATIAGNPFAMLKANEPVAEKEKQDIKVYYNFNSTCNNTYESFYNTGIITLSLIKLLQRMGHNVQLMGFSNIKSASSKQHNGAIAKEQIEIIIDLTEDMRDIRKLFFPMCHPSFVRRILFRVMESTDVKLKDCNAWEEYGITLAADEIDSDFITMDVDNVIIIDGPNMMGVEGECLMTDATNYFEKVDLSPYLGDDSKISYDQYRRSFVMKR